jgi:hypothetical protein
MGRVKIWLRQCAVNIRFRIREFVRRQIRKIVEISLTDLDLMGKLGDSTSSAKFEAEHLGDVANFKGRAQLYRWLLKQAGNDGLFLEFGVYKGDSINCLAGLKTDVTWHGFDSFVGLPHAWTLGARTGAFSTEGHQPAVRKNVKLIAGFFEDTLPPFVSQNRTKKIAVLHIDCDLYSSTKTILENVGPMLSPDSIIIFDEFFNYPGWAEQEYKAFMEYVAEHDVSFEYWGYVRTGGQVAVRLAGRRSMNPSLLPDQGTGASKFQQPQSYAASRPAR